MSVTVSSSFPPSTSEDAPNTVTVVVLYKRAWPTHRRGQFRKCDTDRPAVQGTPAGDISLPQHAKRRENYSAGGEGASCNTEPENLAGITNQSNWFGL